MIQLNGYRYFPSRPQFNPGTYMVGEEDQIPKGTHVCIHIEAQTHTINKCQCTKHKCGLSHRKRESFIV